MIEIKIPFKTPTINHLYGQRGFRKYLKPEAKILRKGIKEIVNKICKKGFILKDTNKLDIEECVKKVIDII